MKEDEKDDSGLVVCFFGACGGHVVHVFVVRARVDLAGMFALAFGHRPSHIWPVFFQRENV